MDLTVIEAGSSFLEGLDSLFKIFWICALQYNEKCRNFLLFLQIVYGLKYSSVPMTVKQLASTVSNSR